MYSLLTLTNAPMTPRLVNLKYSNGRVLFTECKNGYRNRGMWAETGEYKNDIIIIEKIPINLLCEDDSIQKNNKSAINELK